MRNAVTNKIRLLKDIKPNPDWLKSQRSNLLLEISESGKQTRSVWKMPVFVLPNFALKPVIVSLVLLCLIFGGGLLTIRAANNSLPGDLLYPVKITLEDVQFKLSSREAKSGLQAKFVKSRIEELNQIIRETKDLAKKKARVVKAVDNLQEQVVNAEFHAVEAAEVVSEKAAQAEAALIEIKEKIVEELEGDESKEVIAAIDEALAAILTANEERERWIQWAFKEMEEAPVEEIPNE